MTNKNRSKKVKNKNRKQRDSRKTWNRYKSALVILQAVFGVLIAVCFFAFIDYSTLSVYEDGTIDDYVPSIYELRGKYFESDIYTNNLNSYIESLLRFVAIREQMEEDGEFLETKKINIGRFATRNSLEDYNGPEIEYYLGDLIKWGQKGAGDSELFCSYEFYTAKQYCEFFSLDLDKFILGDEYVDDPDPGDTEYFDYVEEKVRTHENDTVASFETLKNEYLSADGKNIEYYVDNIDDYSMMVSYVQKCASDLYSNFVEYMTLSEMFDSENTNIRYAVTMGKGDNKNVFTNNLMVTKWISDKKISKTFKGYGEYIYATPATLGYETNTKAEYSLIKETVIDKYGYAYPDDTVIWISLDKNFPVKDIFSQNYETFQNARKYFPLIISFAAFSIVGFIGLFFVIMNYERKYYSKKNMGLVPYGFDKLPIEIVFLGFVLLSLLVVFGESIFINQVALPDYSLFSTEMYFYSGFIFVDICIALFFLYSLIRRIICGNVFDGSILSSMVPGFDKLRSSIKRSANKISDNGSETIKVWGLYIIFLLFNVFWGSMLLFGRLPILSFVILLIFDVSVGMSLFNKSVERKHILEDISVISTGDYSKKIDVTKLKGDNKQLALAVNEIATGLEKAVEVSIKDEKLKADLITNVSHDIKTPLTSIINYVDLLKRENIENERVNKYITVLDEKSQRLKQLTSDLVEASKITSGNISIELTRMNVTEFVKQAVGEFEEKFDEKGLSIELNLPTVPTFINADPRHLWRVLENILNNVYKYALANTRVYLDVDLKEDNEKKYCVLSLKNISGQKLNIPAGELTERFIRGDVSRSTEGSGLGLSIAKSLTHAQGGVFDIYLDGDLFKVILTFESV